jgi:ribosomal protein S16
VTNRATVIATPAYAEDHRCETDRSCRINHLRVNLSKSLQIPRRLAPSVFTDDIRSARYGEPAQTGPSGSQSAARHRSARSGTAIDRAGMFNPRYLSHQNLVVMDAAKKEYRFKQALGTAAGDGSGRTRLTKRGLRHG